MINTLLEWMKYKKLKVEILHKHCYILWCYKIRKKDFSVLIICQEIIEHRILVILVNL